MFKTLIGKFTVIYWLLFTVVNVPLYLYAHLHFDTVLKTSEEEKITLTFKTLQPIIAYNLSFGQEELAKEPLVSFLEHRDIEAVRLVGPDGTVLFDKTKVDDISQQAFRHDSVIRDPFSHEILATATVYYSNEHLKHLTRDLLLMLLTIFTIAWIIFMVGFFYLREDLKGLALLSRWLKQYMVTRDIEAIDIPGKSQEVRTIGMAANEMVRSLSEYVQRLKNFNKELEQRVEDALAKQHDQERLMIHQSRQAAMGEMLESIAHQWRQPLNNIGLAVTNIETKHALGTLDDEGFDDKMSIISANINYMSDTIDDFRNFLTPDQEKHPFLAERTIRDVFRILGAQLQHDGIERTVQSSCDLRLYGLENEFKQVLLVLLNNARDAIKEQMQLKKIAKGMIGITIDCSDDRGIIEVWDNGGGIDEEILHSIFEPYFTTKFRNQGTGIGLYLAKNIIESRMQGMLTVANIEGGSCFRVSLPMYKENME